MKVVGLISGGKDSCFAMMKCVQYGHQIVALANLFPADDSVDELDSYMYQTVGHQMVFSYSKCTGVPLFRRRIKGSTRLHDLSYSMTPGDEVEDMFILLDEVKRQIPSVTAVSTGAIASDYQRLRVESVCSRLGLVSLAYLWKQDQSLLFQEMIQSGIVAILVKVAAIGLDPLKHLGKELEYMNPHLHKLKELYGINVCGEGGEYETLTLDCPLFNNARIVLDESEVVFHSSDSIASVGILHPLAFHLETKLEIASSSYSGSSHDCLGESDSVCEVLGDNCSQRFESKCQSVGEDIFLADFVDQKLHISKTKSDGTSSISCWLQDSCKTSSDLEADLEAVLMKIELKLLEYGFSWENVIYIHLYVADMGKFVSANEIYVRFITQEKCRFGVPSRCTIELPMLQAGLGRAYAEVLVANNQSKRVLHVQSISCWAPSCIGPYSQATLHEDVLYMAGQLGLDPPTMLLCSGGVNAEFDQALKNCDAVAQCFNCLLCTSAIFFVIYCSMYIPTSDRVSMEDKLATYLKQKMPSNLNSGHMSDSLDPIFLYILVPDLPKGALVEIKPILYAGETMKMTNSHMMKDLTSKTGQHYWGFLHEEWHNLCLHKCVVHGKICAALLTITDEIAVRICSEPSSGNQDGKNYQNYLDEVKIERIARFCVYYLDKFLLQQSLSWNDTMILRIYFRTSLQMSHGALSLIFRSVFDEFAEISQRLKTRKEPLFNLVPVLGAGSSSSMDDLITCELFARKH